MSAGSDRTKKSPQRPRVGDPKPKGTAVARGLAASFASRGGTEKAVGIAACVAIAGFLGAALVNRWGADWKPQPLDLDAHRDRRSPSADG
jgi:hypothetical protein